MKFINCKADLGLWSDKFMVIWGFSLSRAQDKVLWKQQWNKVKETLNVQLEMKSNDKSDSSKKLCKYN